MSSTRTQLAARLAELRSGPTVEEVRAANAACLRRIRQPHASPSAAVLAAALAETDTLISNATGNAGTGGTGGTGGTSAARAGAAAVAAAPVSPASVAQENVASSSSTGVLPSATITEEATANSSSSGSSNPDAAAQGAEAEAAKVAAAAAASASVSSSANDLLVRAAAARRRRANELKAAGTVTATGLVVDSDIADARVGLRARPQRS